jgi:hypothetical protein
MKYLEWNNILANHFFFPENAGKDVHLYLTKNDIINLARPHFAGETESEIWNNFVSAICSGLPGATGNIIAKAKYAYSKNNLLKARKQDGSHLEIDGVTVIFPPYIAYLIFLILPLIEVENNDFRANNYYGKLNQFLSANNINQNIGTTDFSSNNTNKLWKDLEKWANDDKNGDLGLFRVNNFTNSSWIYVGKVFSQCVIPPKAIKRLPDFFLQSGMIPDSVYSNGEFLNYLKQYGSSLLHLPNNIINIIAKDSDELGQTIIGIIKREYTKWTGESDEEVDNDGIINRKKKDIPARLFLQFKINTIDETIKFSYRLFSQNDYPKDLKFGDFDNLYQTNGWSRTLNIDFKEQFEIKDTYNKWIAKFPNKDVRLFVSAATCQLSSAYWIETDNLSKTERMYLLCRNNKKDSIEEWGKSFNSGDFINEDFEGISENYSLYKIIHPTISHNEIPQLTLYTTKNIELIGGLRVNFRTYINDFLPKVEIKNADGNENVFLQYRNSGEIITLNKEESNRWLLPGDIKLNADFVIKVENETFEGNDIAYTIASSDNSAKRINDLQLPKRNSFGKNIATETRQFCLGSNVVNPKQNSQKLFCPASWMFIPLNCEHKTTVTNATYNNHCGNMLAHFLSLKGCMSMDEFQKNKVFEYYFSKQFDSEAQNEYIFHPKPSSVLNLYDYIGILDYDYESKQIVVNPPQFIFIPTDKGRKVLLIGARDYALIESIINTAPKYNLQVEISEQFQSNKYLLLPDVITIKAFGSQQEPYGERNIAAFANELHIKFSNDYFPQIALQDFSANLTDYENSLELTDENDYGWVRKIFNTETLNFEKSENNDFDKSFALMEYKLNEYTYIYKLWKDNKCYQIDKNRGKYLAFKHSNKNVILFNGSTKKVAIPVATPLPRLLSESIMLMSGFAPSIKEIDGIKYRVYENVTGIFTQNLFKLKLGQTPINKEI